MKLVIFADGGSRGNPGPSAVGVAIYKYGRELKEIAKYSKYIGVATNNTAEYESGILALRKAKELGADEVSLYFDSQLIARQLRGEYKVKKQHLKVLWYTARTLIKSFKNVEIHETPRENNGVADELVNIELDRIEREGVDEV